MLLVSNGTSWLGSSLEQFLFRAKYPRPTCLKLTFRHNTCLPPNTACAELDSSLIEKSPWSAFIARSEPAPYISKTFLHGCLWPVVLRKVYFDQGLSSPRRVCTEPSRAGACHYGWRNFWRTNYNGSNCTEPTCPGPNGPRPLWQRVYTEPSCRGSTCQNIVFQMLNTGKILVGRQFMLWY